MNRNVLTLKLEAHCGVEILEVILAAGRAANALGVVAEVPVNGLLLMARAEHCAEPCARIAEEDFYFMLHTPNLRTKGPWFREPGQ